MTDRLWRMERSYKVAAFQGEIRGDHNFMAARRLKDRAVVTHAENDTRLHAGCAVPFLAIQLCRAYPLSPNLPDEFEFAEVRLHSV